jgi:hypothetical protein
VTANKSNTNNHLAIPAGQPRLVRICIFFNILHVMCNGLALTLFVAPVLADDANHSIATDDLAVTTNTLD